MHKWVNEDFHFSVSSTCNLLYRLSVCLNKTLLMAASKEDIHLNVYLKHLSNSYEHKRGRCLTRCLQHLDMSWVFLYTFRDNHRYTTNIQCHIFACKNFALYKNVSLTLTNHEQLSINNVWEGLYWLYYTESRALPLVLSQEPGGQST